MSEEERVCKEWRRLHCWHARSMLSRRTSSSSSSSLPPLAFCLHLVLLLSQLLDVANAQVGVSLCACQPATIDFRFQLDLTCDDRTISEDNVPGVSDSACITNTPDGDGEELSDTTPAIIDTMQILELDQKQQVVSQTVYDDGYDDGDVISFTSTVVENPDQVDLMTLPSGLAVTITGRNAAGQQLLNSWAVRYTNDCEIYPVLEPGMQIGWTVLASTGGPPPQYGFCPADETSTMPPTETPVEETPSPTEPPVEETEPPTEPPVEETEPPTEPPVEETEPPTEPPVKETESPTEPPVEETDVPVTPPVEESAAPTPPPQATKEPSPTPPEPDAPTGIPTCPPVTAGSSSKPRKRKKKSQDSMMSDISKSSKSSKSRSSKSSRTMKKDKSSSYSSSKSRNKAKKLQRRHWEDRQLKVGPRLPTTPFPTSSPAPTACPER